MLITRWALAVFLTTVVAEVRSASSAFVSGPTSTRQSLALSSPTYARQLPSSNNIASKFFMTVAEAPEITSDEVNAAPLFLDEFDFDIYSNDSANGEGVNVRKITSIFLDEAAYPPGSLSVEVLDDVQPVMNAWAKTGSDMGAQTAEKILRRMELESGAGNEFAIVNNMLYTVVIDAWGRSGNPDTTKIVLSFLSEMEKKMDKNPAIKPNSVTYNAIINAFRNDASRAEAMLQKMEDMYAAGEPDIRPNTITFNAVISAYARAGDARAAEDLLGQMLARSASNPGDAVRPDIISYNAVIDAWSKSGEQGAAERAESILDGMQELYEAGETHLEPDMFSYTSVVNAWAKEPSRGGRGKNGMSSAARASAVLKRMGERGIEPDTFLYNSMLDALAKSNNADSAQLASDMLKKMEMMECANAVSYNTVINAMAKSGGRDGVGRAEAILSRMEKAYEDSGKDESLQPDVFSYSGVIDAIARSGEKGAAKRAEAMLERMVQSEDDNDNGSGVRPNIVTWNAVLGCWAKSGEKDAGERAEALLDQMEDIYNKGEDASIRPNAISYTTVMNAYAQVGGTDAAMNAERIFQRMEKANCKPNVHSFNTVINAWVQTGEAGSASRAEDVLRKMEDQAKASDDGVKPNVVSYTTVMNGWVKSGEANSAVQAENVFNRMIEMYKTGNKDAMPNAFSFSVLIDAYIKSGEKGSVQRAENILNKMDNLYRKGNLEAKPNNIHLTTVMDAWSRSGDPLCGQKAEELLERGQQLYEQDGDIDIKPNAKSYNAVINAWAKGKQFGKAQRAREVLRRMVKRYNDGDKDVKPNVSTYTSVLNSCAYTLGDLAEKREALQIASSTYKELIASGFGRPNHITYSTFLRVCSNLIPSGDSRASSMGTVFRKCCEDGQVNDLIIRQLQRSLTPDQIRGLVKCDIKNVDTLKPTDLPSSWTCNVQEVKRKYYNNNNVRRQRR
uniref:Pentacotripeptide-repeat region of PRORP domain-containing protein n=1 Tax=Ditylum brightwellii TaxID=49249 RepID=A0A7S2EBP2_9STRA|mmetsp:Transcript_2274/g.3566  ORF Transcript_2274/g.3566 Transcript_2274/m.3566 type:complete len:958 (+) Transcript_2274:174-3047(+)